MSRRTPTGSVAVTVVALFAASTAAIAQYAESDPRSPNHANYQFQQRQQAEEAANKKRQDEEYYDNRRKEAAEAPQRAGDARKRQEQAARDAQTAAAFKEARTKLLRMAPLPDDRNPLLGRWRVESDGRPQRKDDLGLLMGMLANPGGAACKMVFGGGITEFGSKSWGNSDGRGDGSLGPIAYRADDKRLWAIPEKGIELMGFDVVNPNRVMLINLEGCALVRVGSATPTTQGGPSNRAPAVANAGAPPVSARPTPEICHRTLIDRLGAVRVDEVRQAIQARFTETLTGTVPNSRNLRLDARGSACDDPRVNAMLYDFDAGGVLQSVTLVWARPAGPMPAPIFSERVAALSHHHALPAPQRPGRLQADTSLGRLIVQDMPERNLLLEAYFAPR